MASVKNVVEIRPENVLVNSNVLSILRHTLPQLLGVVPTKSVPTQRHNGLVEVCLTNCGPLLITLSFEG
jgi:hypothetical protein